MMPDRDDKLNSEAPASSGGSNIENSNSDIFGESDRLDWLAFCYVADELTETQRVDFETQLSSDIEAQEALANAVALGRSVFQAQQLTRNPANVQAKGQLRKKIVPTKRLTGQAGWKFWIAAASALVVASLIVLSVKSPDSQPIVAAHQTIGGGQDAADLKTDDDAIESIDSWLSDLVYFDMPVEGDDSLTISSWESDDDSADDDSFQDDEAMDLDGSMVAFYSDVLSDSDSDAGESRTGVEL